MWEAPPMPSALSGIWKKTARLSSSMPSGKSSIEKSGGNWYNTSVSAEGNPMDG